MIESSDWEAPNPIRTARGERRGASRWKFDYDWGDEAPDGMGEREVIERESGVVTESEKKLKPPTMYKVLLHNDDYTTMEFVVDVLQSVFHHSPAQATQIMLHVHRSGIGVAGVYTYEIAETKCSVVESMAKQHEFPLKCSMEPA